MSRNRGKLNELAPERGFGVGAVWYAPPGGLLGEQGCPLASIYLRVS